MKGFLWGGLQLAAMVTALWLAAASMLVGAVLGPRLQARLDSALGIPRQARPVPPPSPRFLVLLLSPGPPVCVSAPLSILLLSVAHSEPYPSARRSIHQRTPALGRSRSVVGTA